MNNPSLKPQLAENWDAAVEYYFEPVGQFSVGYFRKDIRDYIVSSRGATVGNGSDNGYNGDYSGYTIVTQYNGGSAKIQGWEFNYGQQLSFLPGALRGLGVLANYTRLETAGDYGGTANLSTKEVANFVPETGNAGLTFSHGPIGARLLANYTGSVLDTYNTDPSRLLYRRGCWLHNLNVSYQFRAGFAVSCDIVNLLNQSQQLYRYAPDRLATYTINGTTITIGVSGKF